MITNDDEEVGYLTKIVSSFGIITNDSDCDLVTSELGISPTRSRQKGDQAKSEFSPNIAYAPWGIWEVTKTSVGENPELSEHVAYFDNLLEGKFDALDKLRKDYRFERVFYILVSTTDTVGGFELTREETEFISRISDRFTFRIVTNLNGDL